MGADAAEREATPQEITQMAAIVVEALQAGAVGRERRRDKML